VGLFISYSSQDRAAVATLVAALRRAGLQVWIDEQLGGGEMWWAAILEQIRRCDGLVLALSEHSLSSRPCRAELAYAQALRRPILPVQIGPIDARRANPAPDRQIIDFQQPTAEVDSSLVAAAKTLATEAPPLPDPLPPEPPLPYAYLMQLAATVSGPELDPGAQTLLLEEIKAGLDDDGADPSARRDIAALLRTLHARPDITWRTRTDVDALLAGLTTTGPLPTTSRRATKWVIAGAAAALATVTAIVVAVAVTGSDSTPTATTTTTLTATTTKSAPGPFATTASLDAVLLTAQEINTIMGTPLQPGPIAHAFETASAPLSNPDCLGALFPAMNEVYRTSGWTALSAQSMLKPEGSRARTTFVAQNVTRFPSADQASAFLSASRPRWNACSGQTVTVMNNDKPQRYTFGNLVGDATEIAQTLTLEVNRSATLRRVLRAVSNLVIDVAVLGYQLSDEANQITDEIAAKALH
jgi:hypothetical protein